MGVFNSSRRRLALAATAAVVVVSGGLGIAQAGMSSTPSNSRGPGRGINEYGMTKAFFKGTPLSFTYTKGFFCDTTVSSAASTKCEAGATYHHPPAKQFDPLYITVPLGFTQPMSMIDCPSGLICVDHPGTMDLTRLEPALKPLYPQLTKKQLLAALRNFAVPGHDHFVTDANGGKPEWWDVEIIGVTSQKTFNDIRSHKSFNYVNGLIKRGNAHVVGPIPTNLFLYFSVK